MTWIFMCLPNTVLCIKNTYFCWLQKYWIIFSAYMALVTFMSDFGLSDHYVAVVKGGIIAVNPAIQIIDISHLIPPSNTIHGSYVLGQAFRAFPAGTVHLVAVGSHQGGQPDHLAMKLDGHYFVGPDNGLFSLISASEPSSVVSLSSHLGKRGRAPSRPVTCMLPLPPSWPAVPSCLTWVR